MKDQLIFDTTDANTIADSDHVGSHTLSGAGALITSGDLNADNLVNVDIEALDVRSFIHAYDAVGDNWDRLQLVSGALKVFIDDGDFEIATKINGDYDVSTNPTPDSAGIIIHDRAAAPDQTNQNVRPTGASPNADDLDPANIHALDVNAFGMAWDGAAWDRLTATAGALDINIASQDITVTVSDAALADTAILASVNVLDVASTAESVVASALANRKYLFVYNNDNRKMYIGGAGVTEANGLPVSPGSYMELRAGAAIDVKWIGPVLGQEIRALELA